jgi:hypothetical protein
MAVGPLLALVALTMDLGNDLHMGLGFDVGVP